MNVIFVCTGNTCRSPMAEALARKHAHQRRLDHITFSSAGTSAFDGAPATDGAILVGLERGVDLSSHRSRAFRDSMIGDNTIILALATSHLAAIRALAPNARTYLLDDYASRGAHANSVTDPIGGDLDDYRHAADVIEGMLEKALDRLAAERPSGLT